MYVCSCPPHSPIETGNTETKGNSQSKQSSHSLCYPPTANTIMASMLYVANPKPYHSTHNNVPYTQLFQHIPVLEPLYTSIEKNFVAQPYIDFARGTWPAAPLALCGLYMLMITIVPRVMKDRKPFQMKNALALWNLALSLFSFCGMVRTVPHLLHTIATKPFRDTICTSPNEAYGEGACGLWVMLFIFSKVPELVDTFFIVFRKSVSPLHVIISAMIDYAINI